MAACTPSIHVLLGRPLFRLSGTHNNNNSMASVRERTIPTERPPPVREGSSANR
jgi:hypothetical protein